MRKSEVETHQSGGACPPPATRPGGPLASRRYRRRDTGEIVEVLPGLRDRWIAGVRRPNGAVRRLKSLALPACLVRDECQAALDRYAAWKGWREVSS